MKKNVTILVGLVVLITVLYGVSSLMKDGGAESAKVTDVEGPVAVKAFVGKVIRVFEGENVLDYGFDIPETATTSIDMDGALIKVADEETSAPIASVYMSYEGGRGYSPSEYIAKVTSPHVPVINEVGTSTIGLYDWTVAESEGSEWHVAQVGTWLIIVENKKTEHDTVEKILESVSAK
jgi:hypothetical protein